LYFKFLYNYFLNFVVQKINSKIVKFGMVVLTKTEKSIVGDADVAVGWMLQPAVKAPCHVMSAFCLPLAHLRCSSRLRHPGYSSSASAFSLPIDTIISDFTILKFIFNNKIEKIIV
jgi:hypothetical protein